MGHSEPSDSVKERNNTVNTAKHAPIIEQSKHRTEISVAAGICIEPTRLERETRRVLGMREPWLHFRGTRAAFQSTFTVHAISRYTFERGKRRPGQGGENFWKISRIPDPPTRFRIEIPCTGYNLTLKARGFADPGLCLPTVCILHSFTFSLFTF